MFEKNKWEEQLYQYLAKLDAEHIVGVATLLKIELCTYEGDKPIPRDAEEVFLDIFNNVEKMNRYQRRRFLSLMKKAANEKSEVKDGPTTENC